MSPRNRRVTLMLVAVIALFIVCVTPDAVMSTVFGLGYYDEDYLVRSIREITDFLLTVNSAMNFVVYCAFSTVFRNRFRLLITTGCRDGCQSSRQMPPRRRRGGSGLAVDEVGAPADHRVPQNQLPAVGHCSLVMGTNGQSLVIMCSNSSDNVIELISINHDAIVLEHRTITRSSKS